MRALCWRVILGVATVAATLAGAPAHAQGKLEARYAITLAGIPIGRGAWNVEIWDNQYQTGVSGIVTGLMRMLAKGQGAAGARGLVSGARLMTSSYAANINVQDKPDDIRMSLSGGTVKELAVDPPTPPAPDRVPITEAHVHGVVDPLTAGLISIAAPGDVVTPEACRRTLPIFDGRQRYDLELSFKRMERVRAEHGYQGPAVVCMAVYHAIAGHRAERAAIKNLEESREMEIVLAPIAGTRVLAPFRISIPTMLGPAVLQATQFASAAQTARRANAKTQ